MGGQYSHSVGAECGRSSSLCQPNQFSVSGSGDTILPPNFIEEKIHAPHIFCHCFDWPINFDLRRRIQAFQSGNKSQQHDTQELRVQWFWLFW
jgi:hypothetical protein